MWHCHIILGQQSRAHQQQDGEGDSVLCEQGVSSRGAAGAEPQSPKMDSNTPDLRGKGDSSGEELVDTSCTDFSCESQSETSAGFQGTSPDLTEKLLCSEWSERGAAGPNRRRNSPRKFGS